MNGAVISQDMVDRLLVSARRESGRDIEDFNPQDVAGGNFDDAYEMGEEDGYIELAREILQEIGIAW